MMSIKKHAIRAVCAKSVGLSFLPYVPYVPKSFGLSLLPYISFLTKYCRVLRALRDLRARYFGVPYLPYLLYVQKISACPTCLTCRKFWRALQHYVPYVLKILEFYLEL